MSSSGQTRAVRGPSNLASSPESRSRATSNPLDLGGHRQPSPRCGGVSTLPVRREGSSSGAGVIVRPLPITAPRAWLAEPAGRHSTQRKQRSSARGRRVLSGAAGRLQAYRQGVFRAATGGDAPSLGAAVRRRRPHPRWDRRSGVSCRMIPDREPLCPWAWLQAGAVVGMPSLARNSSGPSGPPARRRARPHSLSQALTSRGPGRESPHGNRGLSWPRAAYSHSSSLGNRLPAHAQQSFARAQSTQLIG